MNVSKLVVVSDLHAGCRLGLCPSGGVTLDDGGIYLPSGLQLKLWGMWREFWEDFVPEATDGEPWGLVVNGDAIDGVHHGTTTQVSHNVLDQVRMAHEILAPVVARSAGYYHVRGTEAHAGKSGHLEEQLAESLGPFPTTSASTPGTICGRRWEATSSTWLTTSAPVADPRRPPPTASSNRSFPRVPAGAGRRPT